MKTEKIIYNNCIVAALDNGCLSNNKRSPKKPMIEGLLNNQYEIFVHKALTTGIYICDMEFTIATNGNNMDCLYEFQKFKKLY